MDRLLEIVFHKPGEAPPQATICMPAWNRQDFLAAALSSVFAQRNCQIEIIVSDDCSTDGTLAAALALAGAYGGPHAVTVCRAVRRLRTEHKPAIAALATAPLIVHADSDDTSHPDRVARLLDIHRRTGASLVSTSSRLVGPDCTGPEPAPPAGGSGWLPVGSVATAGSCDMLMGAKYSHSADLFTAFPRLDWSYSPVPPDTVLPFRALLLGGVWYQDEVLLDRAIHPGRWSARQDDGNSAASRMFSLALRRLQSLRVMRRDLTFAMENGVVAGDRGCAIAHTLEQDAATLLETLLDSRAILTGQLLEPIWVDNEQLADRGLFA
jgi:glycosyltransferase involved in cell wall biosynthesis